MEEKSIKTAILKKAFLITIPVLLGYLTIGIAFGLLLNKAGYPVFLAPLMSFLIYAGAAQYIAVGFFTSNAAFLDIAIITFLINSRHMVYGLSLLDKFRKTSPFKPYLIFALTDETYALLTTVSIPEGEDKKFYYFLISVFNQSYWIIGSFIGAVLGSLITFSTKGLDFALTALFVVLLIEQIRHCKTYLPFLIAFICGITALVFFKNNMIIISIALSITILLMLRGFIKNDEN